MHISPPSAFGAGSGSTPSFLTTRFLLSRSSWGWQCPKSSGFLEEASLIKLTASAMQVAAARGGPLLKQLLQQLLQKFAEAPWVSHGAGISWPCTTLFESSELEVLVSGRPVTWTPTHPINKANCTFPHRIDTNLFCRHDRADPARNPRLLLKHPGRCLPSSLDDRSDKWAFRGCA